MNPKPVKELPEHFTPTILIDIEWARRKISRIHPLSYHKDYEFHLIKQGLGKYMIDGKAYCFKTGHLVVIKPNQIHSFVPNPEHKIEKARLMFSADWQADFQKIMGFNDELPNLICLSDAQSLCIEMIINRILEENKQRAKGWEDMVIALFHEFLVWIYRVRDQHVKPARERPVSAQLRRYIEAHYSDPNCTVTSVARRFGYSLNYITALSKEMSGMGLKQYLQQYRIIAARRILEADFDFKIEAVARQAGFNQYRNFTREFLKQTGMSASGYREFYHQHCDK